MHATNTVNVNDKQLNRIIKVTTDLIKLTYSGLNLYEMSNDIQFQQIKVHLNSYASNSTFLL